MKGLSTTAHSLTSIASALAERRGQFMILAKESTQVRHLDVRVYVRMMLSSLLRRAGITFVALPVLKAEISSVERMG